MDVRSLYFDGPETVEVRTDSLSEPAADELLVETVASGISPGSELLVYRGEFPEGMAVDESIDALSGTFEYPLRYGYAAVGEVVDAGRDVAAEWVGRRVFAFVPHADRFTTTADAVVPVDDDVTVEEATLLPSVETATNLVLDGRPRVGERVVVFGAGLVGLCTTHVLSSFPLDELVVVEPMATRRELARTLGADRAVDPDEFDGAVGGTGAAGADLVYELSGQPATLDAAIDAVGYDGRVVVGSWYGSKRAMVDLGGSFHRDRISVESSQVSTIAPELQGRWDKSRRFDVAFDHLRALDTDVLLTETVPFADAADAYRRLDDRDLDAPHVVLTYQ
ncbi:zinc-binding dehydrogenase [Halorubellus salinus]|uniref:zinc-binding dehydrogenase n=1 Tax=Halorubellus salinus TaxID=755309 RepID=UPI001D068857|nr:zinc-binding alcohol dehydrogenase [Halorubellus salinus]